MFIMVTINKEYGLQRYHTPIADKTQIKKPSIPIGMLGTITVLGGDFTRQESKLCLLVVAFYLAVYH